MPSEARTLVNDTLLAGWAVRYRNNQMIADRILTPTPVEKDSDTYPVFGFEHFRERDDIAKPKGKVNEVDWEMSRDRYTVDIHALKGFIANDRAPIIGLDERQVTTGLVMDSLLFRRDCLAIRFITDADNFPATGVLDGTDATDGIDLTDPDADLIGWIDDRKDAVAARGSGLDPQVWAIGPDIWRYVRKLNQLLDRMPSNSTRITTAQTAAELLELEEIIVAKTRINTAAATAVEDGGVDGEIELTRVWPEQTGLLFHRAEAGSDAFGQRAIADIVPEFAKMPILRRISDGAGNVRIQRYLDEDEGSGGGEWIRGALAYGFVMPGKAMGELQQDLLGGDS